MLSLNPNTFADQVTRETNVAGPELSNTIVPSTIYVAYGKRLFDIVIAAFVTVFVLTWMIPLIGLAICVSSRGPMLFAQVRSGRNGRVFHCLKFRTMYHMPTATFAQAKRNDVRITRVGAFLRRTNLDEMPQFWNVLIGDMSIVGPRPHPVQLDDQYWHIVRNYNLRYEVRPGITGLAQVRGARGETSKLVNMKHRLCYDLLYIKKQSLKLDVKVCFSTLLATLKGDANAW